MQAIPKSLIEAAAIDCAGPVRRFFTIIFPLLSPTTFFLLVVNIVYAFFDTFGIIHAVTRGGPAQATNILVYKVYSDGFVGLNLGSSAAQSVILMAHRHHAHRDPVPLRRAPGAVRMSEEQANAGEDDPPRTPPKLPRGRGGNHFPRMLHLMVENRPLFMVFVHLTLIFGVLIVALPIYVTFVASTQAPGDVLKAPIPMVMGDRLVENYSAVLGQGLERASSGPVAPMMLNSLIMAMGIAIGKIAISLLSAFAIVYFRFPGRMLAFWTIFVTLMLPVEVRILPTYEVMADLRLLNTYTGLILPLIASATATFLFRQFFMTVPDELAEAARVDGAGPLKFFWDILLPLSRTNIAALFVILFIYGWNQYLWPLLVTTDESMYTIVMAIQRMVVAAENEPEWHFITAVAILALIPPVLVVVFMQRLFVKGLVETEK